MEIYGGYIKYVAKNMNNRTISSNYLNLLLIVYLNIYLYGYIRRLKHNVVVPTFFELFSIN